MKQRMTTCFAPRKKMVVRVSLKKGWRTVFDSLSAKLQIYFYTSKKFSDFLMSEKNVLWLKRTKHQYMPLNINTLQ